MTRSAASVSRTVRRVIFFSRVAIGNPLFPGNPDSSAAPQVPCPILPSLSSARSTDWISVIRDSQQPIAAVGILRTHAALPAGAEAAPPPAAQGAPDPPVAAQPSTRAAV